LKTSTNALTKRFCALQGWPCETVQSWRGRIRHDLFGIADSIVLIDDKALWVQNCSYGSLKPHRDEIERSPHLAWIDRSGTWLELWEWRKKKVGRKGLWFLRGQTRAGGAWTKLEEWHGPYDLYPTPKKEKARRRGPARMDQSGSVVTSSPGVAAVP